MKKEAESFLRSMAKELAQTPEIRALADDIIASILATWWFQGWGGYLLLAKCPYKGKKGAYGKGLVGWLVWLQLKA